MAYKLHFFLPPLFWSLLGTAPAGAQTASMIRSMTQQQLIEAGRESFVHNCSGCHGMDAQGAGPAAVMLNPRPRNLVAGSFKFRSTPTGTLPTSDDLMRTLDQGVLGTSMPSFRLISNQEKQALVAYIKSLRPTWSQEQGDSYAIPSPPKEIFSKKETLLASAARGRETFLQGCQTCHGDTGLGDGPSVEGLMDAENMPIRPANFTRPYIKSGRTARDVFKAITTGLDGTPMPSFADVYTPEQRWDLVAYVLYRRGQGAGIYSADLSLPSVTKKKTK